MFMYVLIQFDVVICKKKKKKNVDITLIKKVIQFLCQPRGDTLII